MVDKFRELVHGGGPTVSPMFRGVPVATCFVFFHEFVQGPDVAIGRLHRVQNLFERGEARIHLVGGQVLQDKVRGKSIQVSEAFRTMRPTDRSNCHVRSASYSGEQCVAQETQLHS